MSTLFEVNTVRRVWEIADNQAEIASTYCGNIGNNAVANRERAVNAQSAMNEALSLKIIKKRRKKEEIKKKIRKNLEKTQKKIRKNLEKIRKKIEEKNSSNTNKIPKKMNIAYKKAF